VIVLLTLSMWKSIKQAEKDQALPLAAKLESAD
jgi:hypothetical protein